MSVRALALLLAACVGVLACRREVPPEVVPEDVAPLPDAAPSEERVVMSTVLFTLPVTRLIGFEHGLPLDVSSDELAKIHAAAEVDFGLHYTAPVHSRLFFYAFDAHTLTFVLADHRLESDDPRRPEYVARRHYRAPRTPETVAIFGLAVKRELFEFEVGVAGVRPGMLLDDVIATRGPPVHVGYTQVKAWKNVYYDDLKLFVANGVIWTVQQSWPGEAEAAVP